MKYIYILSHWFIINVINIMSDLSHCNIFILILRSCPVLLTYLFHIEIVHVGSYRFSWTKFSLSSSRELTEYIGYTYKYLPYSGVQCMRGRLNIRLSSLCRRCKQMNISQLWVKYTVSNKSTDNFIFRQVLNMYNRFAQWSESITRTSLLTKYM